MQKNSHYAKQAIELLVKRVTIIDKTITLSLTTEGCLSLLVPRTRNYIDRNIVINRLYSLAS